jgi:GNAT superfamily N-acetyltransferase
VFPVAASATHQLRRAILRPGRPLDESSYPGDDGPLALHLGARRSSSATAPSSGASTSIVAVGSVLAEAPPWDRGRQDGWRVRGMAVEEGGRGGGAGTAILDGLLRHVAEHGGGLVWCAARVRAVPLYGRAGFERRGGVFEAPHIGPHVHMWVDLPPAG